MRIWIINLVLVIMLTACSSVPVNSGIENTPTSTPTITVSPTITPSPTPTVEPPSIPHGLRPENAATQTLENGIWVVKNGEGQVTATWNKDTKEWTYNMEAIKIRRSIIGFEGQDANLLKPLFEPLPADVPENHIVNPDTGEPIPFGYFGENVRHISSTTENKIYDNPVAILAVRNLGVIQIDNDLLKLNVRFCDAPGTTNYACRKDTDPNIYGFEIPVKPDDSIVLIVGTWVGAFTVNPINTNHDEKLTDGSMLVLRGDFGTDEQRNNFLNDYRGHQVLIHMYYSYPQALRDDSPQLDRISQEGTSILQYLQNPSGPIPSVGFGLDLDNPYYISGSVWVPESAILTSPFFQK
jgi:hypothetical protein